MKGRRVGHVEAADRLKLAERRAVDQRRLAWQKAVDREAAKGRAIPQQRSRNS